MKCATMALTCMCGALYRANLDRLLACLLLTWHRCFNLVQGDTSVRPFLRAAQLC